MEALLAGKSRDLIPRTINGLLPIIMSTWGSPTTYVEIATAHIANGLGEKGPERSGSRTLAEQVQRIVTQLSTVQLRPIEDPRGVNQFQKAMEPNLASSPVRLNSLRLAVQLQHAALSYLDGPEGTTNYTKVVKKLDAKRMQLAKELKALEAINLGKIEHVLIMHSYAVLGETETPFYYFALVGRLLERVRQYARQAFSDKAVSADFSEDSPQLRLTTALEVPVRQAELNEARTRFATLNEDQIRQRYEHLRKLLLKQIERVAPAAPQGFELFCQTVESLAFPYPKPLEWVRSFLKQLLTNARQSSMFDNAQTVQSINARYEEARQEHGANLLQLQLTRAFALAPLQVGQAESMHAFLKEIDLVAEFNWPATVADYKRGAGAPSKAKTKG